MRSRPPESRFISPVDRHSLPELCGFEPVKAFRLELLHARQLLALYQEALDHQRIHCAVALSEEARREALLLHPSLSQLLAEFYRLFVTLGVTRFPVPIDPSMRSVCEDLRFLLENVHRSTERAPPWPLEVLFVGRSPAPRT